MRKEFKMTDEQLMKILDASEPVPFMIFNGMVPKTQQENVNAAWERLGKELGFYYLTVQPINGKDATYFSAEIDAAFLGTQGVKPNE